MCARRTTGRQSANGQRQSNCNGSREKNKRVGSLYSFRIPDESARDDIIRPVDLIRPFSIKSINKRFSLSRYKRWMSNFRVSSFFLLHLIARHQGAKKKLYFESDRQKYVCLAPQMIKPHNEKLIEFRLGRQSRRGRVFQLPPHPPLARSFESRDEMERNHGHEHQ